MTNERKMIPKEIMSLDMEGELSNVINYLSALLKNYGEDCFISKEQRQWEDGEYLVLMKPAPETDAEMEARIKTENYYKKLTEDSERTVFERLKLKYNS
jgi:hypothetical protein